MITLDVVPGVHRVEHASTNCYLVDPDPQAPPGAGSVLVDGGLPRTRGRIDTLLRTLGRTWRDVSAIVLTHGHFDHLGVCAGVEKDHAVTTWVGAGDEHIARHPYRYRPGRPRLLYPVGHPRSAPHLAAMTAAGALWVRGVRRPRAFHDDEEIPGGLVAVATPGHTDGHVALHLPRRDAVLTGDALVTLDPYTGRRGPRVVARAGTRDAETATRSLTAIAATDAETVLPGHGEPWTDGAAAAVAAAQRAGVA